MSEDLYAEEEFDDDVEVLGEVEDEDNTQGGGGEAEAEEATNQNSTNQPVKPKPVVRRPRPKLNEETLRGKRGLTALPSYFERVKFKGKGHEEEDLSVILKTYEYWCHRLFPRYPFDDCISKIEKLGSKRFIQTYVKKIRLGMIQDFESEPVLNTDESESEGENVNNNFGNIFNDSGNVDTTIEITEEQQEQIRRNKERAEKLRQERLQRAQEKSKFSLRESGNVTNEDLSQVSIESSNMDVVHSLLSETETFTSQTIIEPNEEQQERIRMNKEKAEKLRQAKLKRAKELSEFSINESNVFDGENLSQASSRTSNIENQHFSSSDEDVDSIFNKIQQSEDQQLNSENYHTVEPGEKADNEDDINN